MLEFSYYNSTDIGIIPYESEGFIQRFILDVEPALPEFRFETEELEDFQKNITRVFKRAETYEIFELEASTQLAEILHHIQLHDTISYRTSLDDTFVNVEQIDVEIEPVSTIFYVKIKILKSKIITN